MNIFDKRVHFLLNKGMGCVGMIAEINSKCRLLQLRLKQSNDPDSLQSEFEERLVQMKEDLAKYSRRIKKIYEELESYGIFSDVG